MSPRNLRGLQVTEGLGLFLPCAGEPLGGFKRRRDLLSREQAVRGSVGAGSPVRGLLLSSRRGHRSWTRMVTVKVEERGGILEMP